MSLKRSIRKISTDLIDHFYTISFYIFPRLFDSYRRDKFWIMTKTQQINSIFLFSIMGSVQPPSSRTDLVTDTFLFCVLAGGNNVFLHLPKFKLPEGNATRVFASAFNDVGSDTHTLGTGPVWNGPSELRYTCPRPSGELLFLLFLTFSDM